MGNQHSLTPDQISEMKSASECQIHFFFFLHIIIILYLSTFIDLIIVINSDNNNKNKIIKTKSKQREIRKLKNFKRMLKQKNKIMPTYLIKYLIKISNEIFLGETSIIWHTF